MRAGAIWRCGYFDMQMRMDVIWVLSNLRTKWFHNHFIMLNKQSTEQQQQQQNMCSTELPAGVRTAGNFTPPLSLTLPHFTSPPLPQLSWCPISLNHTQQWALGPCSHLELQSIPASAAPLTANCPTLSLTSEMEEESEVDNSKWKFVLWMLDVKCPFQKLPRPSHPLWPREAVIGEEGGRQCLN